MHPDSEREGLAWASRSCIVPTGNGLAYHWHTAHGPTALRSSRCLGTAYTLSITAQPLSAIASLTRPSHGAWSTYKEQEIWGMLVAKKRCPAVIDGFVKHQLFSVMG